VEQVSVSDLVNNDEKRSNTIIPEHAAGRSELMIRGLAGERGRVWEGRDVRGRGNGRGRARGQRGGCDGRDRSTDRRSSDGLLIEAGATLQYALAQPSTHRTAVQTET
jgi:hypothetical protein